MLFYIFLTKMLSKWFLTKMIKVNVWSADAEWRIAEKFCSFKIDLLFDFLYPYVPLQNDWIRNHDYQIWNPMSSKNVFKQDSRFSASWIDANEFKFVVLKTYLNSSMISIESVSSLALTFSASLITNCLNFSSCTIWKKLAKYNILGIFLVHLKLVKLQVKKSRQNTSSIAFAMNSTHWCSSLGMLNNRAVCNKSTTFSMSMKLAKYPPHCRFKSGKKNMSDICITSYTFSGVIWEKK